MEPDPLTAAPRIDALLGDGAPDPASAAILDRAGVTRLDVWRRLGRRWSGLAGTEAVAKRLLPAALAHALEAPDPDAAVLAVSRLDEQIGGVTLARQIADDPRFGRDLLFLLGFGAWTAETLLRDPGLVDLIAERQRIAQPAAPAALEADLRHRLASLRKLDHRLDALRRWKREQYLAIIVRDRLLLAPQREVTARISLIADIVCRAVLGLAAGEVLGRGDEPPPGLALIAMGKWGSGELNYNSDIDLLCVWEPGRGPDAEAWSLVIQRLTAMIGEAGGEGRLFRVDHRLRPEGAAGALVRSLESYAGYYETVADSWEAQALCRARCCAGDPALGRRFETLAERVAYGARLSRAGVALIRRNRERLDARDADGRNIKEGPGGIRDVEFCCQLLQLVRGVTDPTVRRRNTWAALDALANAGAITEHERRTLAEGYDFLRQVEHLLQLQPAAPTKHLPTDSVALRRLARAMGYRDSGPRSAELRFEEALRSHQTAVREVAERLFWNPIPLASPDAAAHIAELLDPLQAAEEVIAHLEPIRFADPPEARRRLLYLAHGAPPMRLPPEVQAVFVEFLPALLACIQRMPDPDAALRWFERFVSRAGGREPLYRFLVEHPPVIEVLCRIGGFSDLLAQTICDFPEYLNHVVNPAFLRDDVTHAERTGDLTARLVPLRRPQLRLDDIRRFRRRECFRIGVLDLLEVIDTARVIAELTSIAELTLGAVLDELRASIDGAAELPFAVIGCGKLGGGELHYSSDLDVLFVYQPGELGERAPQLAERLARALLQESERRSSAGRLFEIDARLRPDGANSPLVRTIDGCRNYYQRQGQPWERLALTRVRHVAGDPDVGAAFVRLAHQFAFGAPLTEAELTDLRRIKQRIETERRDPLDADHVSIKLEPGGLMDLEYLVQVLQVRHGHERSAIRCANTPKALAALDRTGLLPAGAGPVLLRAYWLYRRLETRLQLVTEQTTALLPLDPAGLAAAARRLGWADREAEQPERLLADLRERMRIVREVYREVVGTAAG